MKKILIFGSKGFIGKNFCNFLDKKKIIYKGYSSDEINLNDQLTLQKIYHSLKSELQSWLVKNKFVTDSIANTALKDIKMK